MLGVQMNRYLGTVLGFLGLLAGCPSVHTLRGAEVLPVGKSEMVTHVGVNGVVAAAEVEQGGTTEAGSVGAFLPWAAFSYRTGVADRLDVQVKAGLDIFPEISAAYQVVGTPGEGGTAVSVSIGAKWFSMGAGDTDLSLVYLPVSVLADLPLGAAKLFLRGGAMVIGASNSDGSEFFAKPLVGLGARVKLGGMTLMPELNYLHAGSAAEDSSVNIDAGLAAFGLGFVF
jgi:hypothetical protein